MYDQGFLDREIDESINPNLTDTIVVWQLVYN